MHLPCRRYLSGGGELNPLRTSHSNVDADKRVKWVWRSCVAALKLESGECKVEIRAYIPFCPDFIIGEFLGCQILLRYRQR